MITNLWYLNLYLIANVLGFLALAAFGWLYLDSYLKKRKHTHHVIRALGALTLSAGFLYNVLRNIGADTVEIAVDTPEFLLFSVGMTLLSIGQFLEPIPLKPKTDGERKLITELPEKPLTSLEGLLGRHKHLTVVLLVLLAPVVWLQSLILMVQTLYKVSAGLSKEFRLLVVFYATLSVYLLQIFLEYIGTDRYIQVEEFARPYDTFWILSYFVLILSIIILFYWIYKFLSFRAVTKIFLNTWFITISIGVLLASAYAAFTISSSRDQVFDLLNNNIRLVRLNIDSVISTNEDIVTFFDDNDSLENAILAKDSASIRDEMEVIIGGNNSVDSFIVASNTGISIYDYDNPRNEGESVSDIGTVNDVFIFGETSGNFEIESVRTSTRRLAHYVSSPIKDEVGDIVGIVTAIKRFDDAYLDILKNVTDQEIIVYIDGRRSASTITQTDGSRLENIPILLDDIIESDEVEIDGEQVEITYSEATIVSTPYFIASMGIVQDDESMAQILVASEQALLLDSTEDALINTFIATMLLGVFATIPSYFISKNLQESLKA